MSSRTLFCLHFLGGSAESWSSVAASLSSEIACQSLDLSGFGRAANEPGAAVSRMAEMVADRVRGLRPEQWWIAGHSMGAKVALAVARSAENDIAGLEGLRGLMLLAGSPPAPEPMSEDQRADMLAWIDQPHAVRSLRARDYIARNVGAPLNTDVESRAVDDVLLANPSAWKLWLAEGAREDWREAIGILRSPALIISGSEDEALGPAAQARLMAPHLSEHRSIELRGAGHLLPIERPGTVADLFNDMIGSK